MIVQISGTAETAFFVHLEDQFRLTHLSAGTEDAEDIEAGIVPQGQHGGFGLVLVDHAPHQPFERRPQAFVSVAALFGAFDGDLA